MKIIVTADAYSATMDVSVEGLKLLQKYNPEALVFRDDKGKEQFRVNYEEGKSSVDAFSITFGAESRDGDKKAAVCGTLPPKTEDAKAYLADMFGVASTYLDQVEERIKTAAEGVRSKRAEFMNNIELN